MNRKLVTLTLAILLTVVVAATNLFAADCQKKIALTTTSAGFAIDASGTAEVRARGTEQRFRVSIDAAVPDGATFLVFANGSPAGSITIVLGIGELDLNNKNGNVLPTGVNPVCSIGAVEVKNGSGALVLQGNF